MTEDKWDKYRKMTWEELIEAIDSGDQEAAAYEYIERCNDEGDSPLGGSIIRYLYGYEDED